jgi:hypothetical protein
MWNWDSRRKERLKWGLWGKRLGLRWRNRRRDREKPHDFRSSSSTKEHQLSKSRKVWLRQLACFGEMDEAWLQNFVWETWRKEIAWETWVRVAKSRDRPIGIVGRPWIGQPRNRGSIFKSPKKFLHSPKRPNSLWGPPSPLFNGYQGRFPQGSSNQRVKLTVHFHLLSRLRMSGAIPPLPRIRSWRVPFMRMNVWRMSGWGHRPMAGSSGHDHESSDCIKGREFINWLNKC